MNVYLFSSKNLTNIWAGIGAGKWAISGNAAGHGVIRAGANRLPVGALGLFYCTEVKAFTTPFVILSQPDAVAVVNDIWPESWRFSFSIRPFGTPLKILAIDEALNLLPTLQQAGKSDWTKVMHFQPMTSFQPSTLSDQDWQLLVQTLAQ